MNTIKKHIKLYKIFFLTIMISCNLMAGRIAGGYGFSVAIDQNGDVWLFSYEPCDKCADPLKATKDPFVIPGLSNIVQVFAGSNLVAALDCQGQVWVVPINLSLGNISKNPVLIEKLTDVRHVAVSDRSVMVCDDRGIMSVNNVNDCGELIFQYQKNLSPIEIVQISRGSSHTVLLDNNESVWTFGPYDNVLGRGRMHAGVASKPGEVGLRSISKINAKNVMTFAIDNIGQVYGFGDDYNEFLPGAGSPTQIAGLVNIIQVEAKSGANIALDNEGRVWAFGRAVYYFFGVEEQINKDVPFLIDGLPPIVEIAAGTKEYLFLDMDGNLWTHSTGCHIHSPGAQSLEDLKVVKGLPNMLIVLPPQIKSAGSTVS